ncbi:MAG: hypothetical protein CVV44_14415 [Spirochaetae bacterium HGW-Spirochaetae-1]|jgi:outer membrane translocation and assembly module TamA|nr:MAG: hypothetical protein CVV44_14415 [Spirochaetae bacterium HGW-Spirochaetae-1]
MSKILKLSIAFLLCLLYTASVFAAQQLPADVVEKKKEGWYFTGLPLVNYTTDDGFGFGARVYFYDNGPKDGENFANEPYSIQLYGQFYMTLLGYHYDEINLDYYNMFGTNLRLKSALVLDMNKNANFYGVGAKTTSRGLTDNLGNSYDTMKDYEDAFLNGIHSKFDKYQYIKPNYFADVYGDITKEFTWVAGFRIAYWDLSSWDGKKFDGDIQDPTRLDLETPYGKDGALYNTLRMGIAWNTLDYEPDPRAGFNIDYSLETSQKWLGSESYYFRNTVGARYYYTPWKPLTFAIRLGYTSSQLDMPFYEMNWFAFPYARQQGLGGNRTLRGFPSNRFVAKTMTMGNLEVRYSFWEWTPGSERFEFKVVAFYDAGNAYDDPFHPIYKPRFGDYQHCGGGGLVIAWNQATLVHFYFGASKETTAISVDFMHAIQ